MSRIRRLSLADGPGLLPLLCAWPDLPLRHLDRFPPAILARDFIRRLTPDHRIWAVPGQCAAAWRPLPWDSARFGLPMGRIDLLWALDEGVAGLEEVLGQVLEDAAAQGVRHLACRLEMARERTLRLLEDAGFRLMDTLHTLSRQGGPDLPGPALRGFQAADLEPLLAMARAAFARNRFSSDPHLPLGPSLDLHAAWTRNCLTGQRGDWVGIHDLEGRPAGFIACLLHRLDDLRPEATVGIIDLVAVDQASQGHGVGLGLVRGALAWMAERSVCQTVGTRCDNFPALALYLKAGFRITSSKIGVHRWTP